MRGSVFLVLVTVMGIASAPLQAQEDTAATVDSLRGVLQEFESGERVRLHLAGREPVAASYADVSSDSLFVGREGYTASVALSQVERLEVARHPYRWSIGAGVFGGMVLGFVIGGLSVDVEQCAGRNCDGSVNQLAPMGTVFLSGIGGGLAGIGVGTLVGSMITDWEQRYPPQRR